MDVQCTTSNKKWLKIEKHEDAWMIGNSRTPVKKIYLKKATLASILEFICVDTSGKCHYFNRDWTKKPIVKTKDDDKCVSDVNDAASKLMDGMDCVILDDRFKFEGNHGKLGTCSFYAQDSHVISPDGRMVLPYADIDTIWLERAQLSTVVKTFDVTFIVNHKRITVGMVSKQLYRHKFVHGVAKKEVVRHNTRPSRSMQPKGIDTTKIFSEFRIYVTEDDDLNWNVLLKAKCRDGYTWEDVYNEHVGNDVEELSEEDCDTDGWKTDDTEDDGETEEEEHLSEDDPEEDYPSGGTETESEESDDVANVFSDDDDTDDEVNVGRKRLKSMKSPRAAKRSRLSVSFSDVQDDSEATWSECVEDPHDRSDTDIEDESSDDEYTPVATTGSDSKQCSVV